MNRKRLPNRHEHEIRDFEHHGQKYRACFARYQDTGAVAELFMDGWKLGSDMESIVRDASIFVSKAFQRGESVDEIVRSATKEPNNHASAPHARFLQVIAAEDRAAKKAGGE